jgi:hypothetical protein
MRCILLQRNLFAPVIHVTCWRAKGPKNTLAEVLNAGEMPARQLQGIEQ